MFRFLLLIFPLIFFTGCSSINDKTPLKQRAINASEESSIRLTNIRNSSNLKDGDFILDFSNCKISASTSNVTARRCEAFVTSSSISYIFWPIEITAFVNTQPPSVSLENPLILDVTNQSTYNMQYFAHIWFDNSVTPGDIDRVITSLFSKYATSFPNRFSANGKKLTVKNVSFVSAPYR